MAGELVVVVARVLLPLDCQLAVALIGNWKTCPPAATRPWLTFTVGPDAVRELADDLSAWLAAPPELHRATRAAIVAAAREHYSWEGVARSVIAAARGQLDGLPRPAPDIGASG